MKIAYVLNTYPQITHSFIRRELKGLEAEGFEIERIAMRRGTTPLVDPLDRAEAARTSYVLEAGAARLMMAALRGLTSDPAGFLRAFRLAMATGAGGLKARLRQLIYLVEACHVLGLVRAAGAEHLHAHFGTNAAMVAMLVQALGGPGYSFTVHGPEEFDAPGALSLAEKMTRAAFVVGVSRFGRSQLCRWLPHTAWEKVKVVHCSIDAAHFPAPVPLPEGPLRLVTIGRFAEQKGQLVLPPMLAALRTDCPDIHLTVIGDGDLRGALEASIAAEGVGDLITLAGWQDEAGVRKALADAHALILPSFAEGLPMVIMEAMAMGRPVIATYIAGIPELVREGEEGWLVPAGDPSALADAVRALANMPDDRRAEMSVAAWHRVHERHDMNKEAGKLARHIRDAVGAGP
ncbi:MAG: glycosyltransferase [Roseovarius sp.]